MPSIQPLSLYEPSHFPKPGQGPAAHSWELLTASSFFSIASILTSATSGFAASGSDGAAFTRDHLRSVLQVTEVWVRLFASHLRLSRPPIVIRGKPHMQGYADHSRSQVLQLQIDRLTYLLSIEVHLQASIHPALALPAQLERRWRHGGPGEVTNWQRSSL